MRERGAQVWSTFLFRLGVAALALAPGCRQEEPGPSLAATAQKVAGGAFAVVGGESLSMSLLDGASPSQLQEVADGVVHDALLSRASRESNRHRAQAIERAVLSRSLLESWEQESEKKQPIQQSEIDRQRALNWTRLDRPRAVRTFDVHIPVEAMAPDQEAYAFAGELLQAVQGSLHIQDFIGRLQSVDSKLKFNTRPMPPVAKDGRVVPVRPQDREFASLPEPFAKAAVRLREAGDISDIVGLEDGFHILLATEIIPAYRAPDEEVNGVLAKGALSSRVRRQLNQFRAADKTPIKKARADLAPVLRLVWRKK